MYRGAVAQAIRGRRGQAFLREMLASMDSLPERKLIAGELQDKSGAVCAIGSVGASRGLDMSHLNYCENSEAVASFFGIARSLAAEIEFINDDDFHFSTSETAERRFERVWKWVEENIKE